MTNLSLVHYYFGDREKAFLVGLGTILRAKGHSKLVSIILIDDHFSLTTNFEEVNIPYITVESRNDKDSVMNTFFDALNALKNTVCLIANFDILISSKKVFLQDILQILYDIDSSNEFIFTSEKHFKELEEFADYVSSVHEL